MCAFLNSIFKLVHHLLHYYYYALIASTISNEQSRSKIDRNILHNIYHEGRERIMTILWRSRARRWVSKYSKQSISARRICVYRRILLPTFHECHDLLTQVSLKVFEIIRRPSCGHPVTIHEAVTAVRQKIKPERNLRPSW